jgi:iron complex outermembrane receptor protein
LSSFAQDEIKLFPEQLSLTIGSKFEHNNYTGSRFSPTLACSGFHVLGIPSGPQFPGCPYTLARLSTTAEWYPAFSRTWRLTDCRDGWVIVTFCRKSAGSRNWIPLGEQQSRWSLDVATFFNVYDNIQSFERGDPALVSEGSMVYLQVPVRFDNKVIGETFGLEASGKLAAI